MTKLEELINLTNASEHLERLSGLKWQVKQQPQGRFKVNNAENFIYKEANFLFLGAIRAVKDLKDINKI